MLLTDGITVYLFTHGSCPFLVISSSMSWCGLLLSYQFISILALYPLFYLICITYSVMCSIEQPWADHNSSSQGTPSSLELFFLCWFSAVFETLVQCWYYFQRALLSVKLIISVLLNFVLIMILILLLCDMRINIYRNFVFVFQTCLDSNSWNDKYENIIIPLCHISVQQI